MMNRVSTVDRYLLRELSIPFALSLFLLTLLILLHQLLRLMELLINKGVGPLLVTKIFFLVLPSFFLLTIPMAVLAAAIIAFNRLAGDNEILALRASGVSTGRLLRPALFFSLLAMAATLFLGFSAQPWSGRTLRKISSAVLKARAAAGIEEGTFNAIFPNMLIYVDQIPRFDLLRGILISDTRNPDEPVLLIAKEGIVVGDIESNSVLFRLEDGSIHRQTREKEGYQRITFSTYELKLDIPASPASLVEEPGPAEIRRRIAARGDPKDLRLLQEYYKKYALALACVMFGLIGPPLGILAGRHATRLVGFTFGSATLAGYYILNTFGDFLVAARFLPPLAAALFPDVILGLLAAFLLWGLYREGLVLPQRA